MTMKKLDFLAILVVLVFLISGVITLDNYGLSWDEGLGSLFFGERYFLFFTSFDEYLLDFKANLPYHEITPLNLFESPFKNIPYEFPPLSHTLSAATMYIVSYWAGLMDPVDGWHLFTVLLSSTFLWIFYRFSSNEFGREAAFVGLIFLATFPRFWTDMHFNPKDVPETIFISFVILLYYSWHKKPNYFIASCVGILAGCALGVKLNAIFIPFILVFGVMSWKDGLESLKTNILHIKSYFFHYSLMLGSFIITYFLIWPYLWDNPSRIKGYFIHMLSQGGREAGGKPGAALLQTITTMPEVMIIALFLALYFLVINRTWRTSPWLKLLIVWMLVPIIRSNLPGIRNFDGIRHFLEFVPPAAMLAGWGIHSLVNEFIPDGFIRKRMRYILVFCVIVINLIQINLLFHPYQHLYYNQIVGGLSGAKRIFGPNEATDYWAVSYRNGIQWINENGSEQAGIYTPVAPWLVKIPAGIWFREDIKYIDDLDLEEFRKNDKDLYVMFITRPAFYNEIARYCVSNLEPIHAITIDDVNILEIYIYN